MHVKEDLLGSVVSDAEAVCFDVFGGTGTGIVTGEEISFDISLVI